MEQNPHLKHEREIRGWSQAKVAEKIGTDTANVGRWERGASYPYPHFREKLCQLFGKNAIELGLVPASKLPSSPEPVHPITPAIFDPFILYSVPEKPLIGRERLLASLSECICSGKMLTLYGLPGMGKTALASAIACVPKVQNVYTDGILWAGLGRSPNILALLARWGILLGISPPQEGNERSIQEWVVTLRMTIGMRRFLLVIDDIWEETITEILQVVGPRCAYILTTRFPRIAHSWAGNEAIEVTELQKEDAIALLAYFVPDVVAQEADLAQELVQSVGALPLALTLIGKYLATQTCSQQPRRLQTAIGQMLQIEQRMQLTTLAPVSGYPLHQQTMLSLQSVIGISDQHLSEQERAVLRALSVFPTRPNTFSEEAALAVMGAPIEALDILCDVGLVESNSSDRYTLHQTIADYARMNRNDETVFRKFVNYFIHFVEEHQKDYKVLEQESGIIQAALATAFEQEMRSELVRGVLAWSGFLMTRGLYELAEQHILQAYQAAQHLEETHNVIRLLTSLGEIVEKRGKYEQANPYLEEALRIAQQLADYDAVSRVLTMLGVIAVRRGRYEQAEKYCLEGLALARQTGQREITLRLLNSLGGIASHYRGAHDVAETYYQEGLNIANQVDDHLLIARLLNNSGTLARKQGRYEQAQIYYQQNLALASQIGHYEMMGIVLNNLGGVEQQRKNYEQAQAYYQQGFALAQQIGHYETMGVLLMNLAQMADRQRNYTQAQEYYQQGLQLLRQGGYIRTSAAILIEWGEFYMEQQRIDSALAAFHEALEVAPKEAIEVQAAAEYGLARLAATQDRQEEAQRRAEASLSLFTGIGHRKVTDVQEWLQELTMVSHLTDVVE